MTKFKGEYPPNIDEILSTAKNKAGWKCERCGHAHDPLSGHTLTVHHLDNDKSNSADWNLAVLCQKCHLHIQGKVEMSQFFMFEHSAWMRSHVQGYYKSLELPKTGDSKP